jgi:hypothetical protein
MTMNSSADAAEQIVRISLAGTEYALKIAGNNAGRLGKLLVSLMQQKKKTKGKVRVANMLKSAKPLSVFEIKQGDLEQFAKEAKRYGVKYAAIRDPKAGESALVDLMVAKDDESKINRIIEKFNFAVVDTSAVIESIERERADKPATQQAALGVKQKSEAERIGDEFVSAPLKKETQMPKDPTQAQTRQSRPSEPTSTPPEISGGVSARDTTSQKELEAKRSSVKKEIDKERLRRGEQKPKPKVPPAKSQHTHSAPSGKAPRKTKPAIAKER